MAVGFEFATGWEICKVRDGVAMPAPGLVTKSFVDQHTVSYPKAAVVRGGFGWKMTVDGTEIEYVVDPVEESPAGEQQLFFVMSDLQRFVRLLNARNMQRYLTAANFPPGTFKSPNDRFVIEIDEQSRMKPIDAIPQVTGGVRLGRIRKLWRLLADPTSNAAKQFFAESQGGMPIYSAIIGKAVPDAAGLRDPKWAGHAPSAKLRGLLTLIATYLLRGYSPNQDGVGAVKYLFILMSRTKFSALFSELPNDEQLHYRGARADWVDYVCREVMGKLPGMPPDGVNPDGLVIERKVTDRGNLPVALAIPITRRAWLTGMLDGNDLLSAEAHPLGLADNDQWEDSNPGLGHRLRGLAGLGDHMDDIAYRGRPAKGAILEFRARQAALDYTQWADYARRMHRFFTEVNEGDRHGVLDLDAPALA